MTAFQFRAASGRKGPHAARAAMRYAAIMRFEICLSFFRYPKQPEQGRAHMHPCLHYMIMEHRSYAPQFFMLLKSISDISLTHEPWLYEDEMTDPGEFIRHAGYKAAVLLQSAPPPTRMLEAGAGSSLISWHPFLYIEISLHAPEVWLEQGIMHELLEDSWRRAPHAYFSHLGLMPYDRTQWEIWFAYVAMFSLQQKLSSFYLTLPCFAIERLLADSEYFTSFIHAIHPEICVPQNPLIQELPAEADSMAPFFSRFPKSFETIWNDWPFWKKEAFQRILSPKILARSIQTGHKLPCELI